MHRVWLRILENLKKNNCEINIKNSCLEKLNILHTVEFYNPHIGGAEYVVQQLSERLVKRGHSVTVATSRSEKRLSDELNGVKIVEFDLSGGLSKGVKGKDLQKYQGFLVKDSSDIMMNYAAQQWATDIVFTVIDKLVDSKVNVFAPCGYSALQDSKTIRWNQYTQYFTEFIPKIIPLYHAAVYHSANYHDYEFALDHNFKNSVIISNGVSEEEFENKPAINFRQRFDIKKRFMGLCVANYYKDKGHDRIIDVFRKLNRNDLTVVFIGQEGEELDKLRKSAENLDIIFLIGISREDTVAAFHQADVFLFGSHIEAFPLVILEAKASKTPFVTTNCGNVKELKGGIVCDESELAGNINKVLNDKNLRQSLSLEGYKEWKEKFTWESVTDQYEALYLNLYKRKFEGETASQISIIQNRIEKNYMDVNNYLKAAQILVGRNDYDTALKYLEDALELDYENKEVNQLLRLIRR